MTGETRIPMLKDYYSWLRSEHGLSHESARMYADAVWRVKCWCEDRGLSLETLTRVELDPFVDDGWSRSYKQQLSVSLRRYWAFTGRSDAPTEPAYVPPHPPKTKQPRRPRGRRRPLVGEDRRFAEWLYVQGYAEQTVRNYVGNAERFSKWCATLGIDPLWATGGELATYAAERTPGPWAKRLFRASMKQWFAWKEREDAPLKAIRTPPKPRPRWRGLEDDEARAITKAAMDWYPQGTAVLIGLYLGLRANEIATLRWSDFDSDMRWVTVTGKGSVTASLPLHDVLRWQLEVVPRNGEFVFPGHHGRRHITPATIWAWVGVVAEAAGVDRHIHTHMLRYTAISRVNDATKDLSAAQEFARHARPETTAQYSRVTKDRLQAAVDGLDFLSEA